jgi:hypothetical protein
MANHAILFSGHIFGTDIACLYRCQELRLRSGEGKARGCGPEIKCLKENEMTLYYQCKLSQDTTTDVAYIEARAAKLGALVEVKGYEGLWRVDQVGDKGIEGILLSTMQKNGRNYVKNTDI